MRVQLELALPRAACDYVDPVDVIWRSSLE
jgi:hypothetical protein